MISPYLESRLSLSSLLVHTQACNTHQTITILQYITVLLYSNIIVFLQVTIYIIHVTIYSMLLRRGVDAGREDHSKRVAEMLAWQRKEMECVQLIRKHNEERCFLLCQEIISSKLDVSSLFPSDYCLVNKDGGHTLLMVAVLHNQKETVQQLVSHDQCPRNFVHYPSKKTAVTIAAELCNVECLKSLLE